MKGSNMLEDKVTLITGASQGLGRALALAFAREGARVVVNARSEESIRPVAEEVEGTGAEVLAVAADVSKSADVERLVDETVERFGRIDVLVNNAGLLGPRVGIEEYPEDEWRRVIDANLTGPFLVSKAAIPHLPEGGSIINVVSGVSVEGRAEWGAYSVSKFGMEGLTQILAAELAGRGDPRERRRPRRDAHGHARRRLPRGGPADPHNPGGEHRRLPVPGLRRIEGRNGRALQGAGIRAMT